MFPTQTLFCLLGLVLTAALNGSSTHFSPSPLKIAEGQQPTVSVAPDGTVGVAYGKGEQIIFTMSKDNGNSFAPPVVIDSLPGLALGATRGPQIASSSDFTVITALTEQGDVYAYTMNHKNHQWSERIKISDVPHVAPEGLVSIAAGADNYFFAVWLDGRQDQQNKIVGTLSTDGGRSWSSNHLIYQSPDKGVCSCCKPSVALDQDNHIYVMFRNWLNGSRDLHLIKSTDNGKTFGRAQKLGKGTWKQETCPMDGGGIALGDSGKVTTAWRRENEIYLSVPGQTETVIGKGRNVSIAQTSAGPIVVWQHEGKIISKLPS